MLSAYESGPPLPQRGTSIGAEKDSGVRNIRESVGILFLVVISVAVLFSSICIFKYALRDKAVYEELVDYLDKTVSISKINYNPMLGLYELKAAELDILNEERKYKSLVWTFLFADLASLLFFGISAFFYFSVEKSRGIIRVLFWFFLVVGTLYSLLEAATFAVLISPYSTKLPNSTIVLLDHAIPYNPGGLAQMESRFGCIFDQNLYDTFRRHLNPRNTCDPLLQSSFLPHFLLILFIVTRAAAVILFLVFALTPNSAASTAIARFVLRMKPAIHYKKNTDNAVGVKKPGGGLPAYYGSPAKTTFGVKEHISSPLPTQIPPTPPLGQMDHTISYNNAALFAISGANVNYGLQQQNGGGGSSRCSDISAIRVAGGGVDHFPEMAMRGSTHTTNSLVSEV